MDKECCCHICCLKRVIDVERERSSMYVSDVDKKSHLGFLHGLETALDVIIVSECVCVG